MYSAPRGTADVLPDEQPYWDFVRGGLSHLCRIYGYERIEPPVFEQAGLYVHGTGEATDIVRKEMYIFEDRGGEQMALRPEMTPNVARAYIQHGLFNLPQPVKLYYEGPAFRYERPQSGRYRQFDQFGIEALGEADAALDAEIVEHAWRLLEGFGLHELTLQLNSIGDAICRPAYVQQLRAYYCDKLSQVCSDCRDRFERNPMRLLDCKRPMCQPVIAGAPVLSQNLCDACRDHFAALREYLTAEGVPYSINQRLVRGLDYYTRTVFEIMPDRAGSQGTIAAGGRYDGLLEIVGGRPTPGIGYASSIERVVLNLKKQGVSVPPAPRTDVFVLHEGEEADGDRLIDRLAVELVSELRRAGVPSLESYGRRSLKSQMRQAGRSGAHFAVIVDEQSLRDQSVLLRDLESHDQQRLSIAALLARFRVGARLPDRV